MISIVSILLHCSLLLNVARQIARTDEGWIESYLFIYTLSVQIRTSSITLRQNILLKDRC